jgi:hypothetical protein
MEMVRVGSAPVSAGGAAEVTDLALRRAVTVLGAVLTALLTALFADWGTYTGPLAGAVPWLPGVALPWRLTGPVPALPVLCALLVAVPLLYAKSAEWGTDTPAPRVFFRAWSVLAFAWLAAGAVAELVRIPLSGLGPAPSVTEEAWAVFTQAAYGGLHGLYLGWPIAAAIAVMVRVRARGPGASGTDRTLSSGPYVWLSAGLLAGPLLTAVGWLLVAPDSPSGACTPTGCLTAHDGALFMTEVMLRLMLPIWAAAIAALAGLRRASPWLRARRPYVHVLIGLGFGALAFPLAGLGG